VNGRELTCRELVELVTDYLEERLSATDRARFEEHLAICADCREYVEQMRHTLRALGRLPEERLSATARAELLNAFRSWHADT
jgi:anti-sigma factor RsiW